MWDSAEIRRGDAAPWRKEEGGKGKKGSSSSSSASAFLQVRPLVRAADTVLGDAGNEAGLFLAGSLQPVTRPLGEVVPKVAAAPRAQGASCGS